MVALFFHLEKNLINQNYFIEIEKEGNKIAPLSPVKNKQT